MHDVVKEAPGWRFIGSSVGRMACAPACLFLESSLQEKVLREARALFEVSFGCFLLVDLPVFHVGFVEDGPSGAQVIADANACALGALRVVYGLSGPGGRIRVSSEQDVDKFWATPGDVDGGFFVVFGDVDAVLVLA